jgi:arginase
LDQYLESGIYTSTGVPFNYGEPILPANKITSDEVLNVGRLGGLIAEQVAMARNDGSAICMTGGNCCHMTGIIGGLQDALGSDARIGLVWFDAHGDYNTSKTTLSGMLGGMPIAVAAGLTYHHWREESHIHSPLPTDRIVLVNVRNLDPLEEKLIRSTDTAIASIESGTSGDMNLKEAIDLLINKVDYIYLHIDSDILDERYTPNHWTKEGNGPDLDQVKDGIQIVMATGKVAAFAVVSVPGEGPGAEVMVNSGKELINYGLAQWKLHGMA